MSDIPQIGMISADSHVTEAPETYIEYIESRWKSRAPRMRYIEKIGDVYEIDGMRQGVPMSVISAAGRPADKIRIRGARFEDLHRGGWDPKARLSDQDSDGVRAEIIYPSVGMVLCSHPDIDYKAACFAAYNRWIAQFCEHHSQRLIGCGQVALKSVSDGIRELNEISKLGLRGVLLPAEPNESDYDSPIYDLFWERVIELGLVPAFHILTDRAHNLGARQRGPILNSFLSVVRGCQDVLGTLVLGGVFTRHPQLRVVCAEADAGWVPHYVYRMDHAYERHRHWLSAGQQLTRRPSELFLEHIYLTFQDDWPALRQVHDMRADRLLWANDFPHADSTWPESRSRLAPHLDPLSPTVSQAIVHDNAASLYGITRVESVYAEPHTP